MAVLGGGWVEVMVLVSLPTVLSFRLPNPFPAFSLHHSRVIVLQLVVKVLAHALQHDARNLGKRDAPRFGLGEAAWNGGMGGGVRVSLCMCKLTAVDAQTARQRVVGHDAPTRWGKGIRPAPPSPRPPRPALPPQACAEHDTQPTANPNHPLFMPTPSDASMCLTVLDTHAASASTMNSKPSAETRVTGASSSGIWAFGKGGETGE